MVATFDVSLMSTPLQYESRNLLKCGDTVLRLYVHTYTHLVARGEEAGYLVDHEGIRVLVDAQADVTATVL